MSSGFGVVPNESLVELCGNIPAKGHNQETTKNHHLLILKIGRTVVVVNLHSSRSLRRIFPLHIQTATMVTSDSDFTIQLQDSRDVQMYFEVEKSGILQAVFHQYSKIEGVPREFNRLAI
jgi:hypothetical protein